MTFLNHIIETGDYYLLTLVFLSVIIITYLIVFMINQFTTMQSVMVAEGNVFDYFRTQQNDDSKIGKLLFWASNCLQLIFILSYEKEPSFLVYLCALFAIYEINVYFFAIKRNSDSLDKKFYAMEKEVDDDVEDILNDVEDPEEEQDVRDIVRYALFLFVLSLLSGIFFLKTFPFFYFLSTMVG